jgi:hypothetical protein
MLIPYHTPLSQGNGQRDSNRAVASSGRRRVLVGVQRDTALLPNTFQTRRFASQTKPMRECHPERELWISPDRDPKLALRMTKREGLFFEMYCPQGAPPDTTSPLSLRPSIGGRTGTNQGESSTNGLRKPVSFLTIFEEQSTSSYTWLRVACW